MACLSGYAQGLYLHIETAEGWKVIDLEKVDRLSFAGGVMTATDSENKTVATVAQEKLQTMRVDDVQEAGLESVIADGSEVFTYNAATRTLTFLQDGPLSIYGIDGAEIHTIPSVTKGQTVSLEDLRPGIIILKSGDFSLKTVVK